MLPGPSDPFYTALGVFVVDRIRRRFAASGQPGASWPPPVLRPGGKPLLESGILMRSIGHLTRAAGTGVELSIGTADKRAALLHFGGTVYAKRAKALFIPLTKKGRMIGPRPAGERRVTVRNVRTRGGSIVAEKYETFELKRGVDFTLKRSVTIPARPFLFFATEDVAAIEAFVRRELRRRLRA